MFWPGLLWDDAVVLRLVLSHGRVVMDEQGRSFLPGPQELPRCHQITVTLRVREGIAGATGAHAPWWWAARCRSRQRLLTHLISHLGELGDIEVFIHHLHLTFHVGL